MTDRNVDADWKARALKAEARVAELEAALKPFALYARMIRGQWTPIDCVPTIDDLVRAESALSDAGEHDEPRADLRSPGDVDCPACNGVGYIRRFGQGCSECGGLGFLNATVAYRLAKRDAGEQGDG